MGYSKFDYRWTCPEINHKIADVQDSIYDMIREVIEYTIDNKEELESLGIKEFINQYYKDNNFYEDYFESHIEDIRKTNSDIRTHAENVINEIEDDINDKIYEIQDLESQIETLEDRLSDKDWNISDLEADLRDAKNEIDRLENQIDKLNY